MLIASPDSDLCSVADTHSFIPSHADIVFLSSQRHAEKLQKHTPTFGSKRDVCS